MLITKKYEEADLKDKNHSVIDKSAEESEKEKKAIFQALEGFQMIATIQGISKMKTMRRKSMPFECGIHLRKWKI